MSELTRQVCRTALGRGDIADAARLCLSGCFGHHLGLGIDADCCGDVLCEPESQLAGSAAQVEKSSGAVEVESCDEVCEEHARLAGPVSRVVPGSAGEKGAVGAAGGICHAYLLLFNRAAILSCGAIDLTKSHRLCVARQ